MGDIFGIVVLIIIYVVAAAGKAKKKQAQQGRQTPRRTAPQARKRQAERTFAKQEEPKVTEAAAHEGMRCEQQRMHLHDVTQEQMHEAGEGEDPCHAGGAPRQEEKPILVEEIEEPHPLAQDVLRGVIMSEILQRPCERMAARKHGRRA